VHLQVLSSGSEGNSTLLRAGELCALVDAGLGRDAMLARMATARLGPEAIRHVLVTHGHLDHARSAGIIARRERATLHTADAMLQHPWAVRAKSQAALAIGRDHVLKARTGDDELRYRAVPIPHDCDPTVAFRFEHEGRVAVILTDMGRPDADVARELQGAHVLVLEFNYDPALLASSPYPATLQRRISGGRGHLSNAEGARMLELLASERLHTLVVAHVSQKSNLREIAEATARQALESLGLTNRVRVIVASQHEVSPSLEV